jgi:hypothetical protein
MSAFVVSIPHVHAVVAGALSLKTVAFDQASADVLGQMLLRENARSVTYRYRLEGTDEARYYEALAEGYRYEPQHVRPLVQIAKLVYCYAYQACECEDWERTDAYRFVHQMQAALLRALPGWDAASWAVD